MQRILEIRDKTGRLIYLTDERYTHILKHPEMQNSLNIIKETVESPIKVSEYSPDPTIKYFYSYHKNRKSRAKHLRAIVKYLNGEGFIITAYFVANPL